MKNSKVTPATPIVGQTASYGCGSDSYGFYVQEVRNGGKMIGLYAPEMKYVVDYYDGSMEATEDFDPNKCSTEWFVKYGKAWYRYNLTTGERSKGKYNQINLHFGNVGSKARAYRDPSF